MKKNRLLGLASAAFAALVAACSLPQLGVGPDSSTSAGSSSTVSTSSLGASRVLNDPARGQAIYVTGTGSQIDVSAPDSTTGSLVKCVDATGYWLTNNSSNQDQFPFKAVVVGKRSDGKPGVWTIGYHDHIGLPQNEQGDDDGALTPPNGEGPEEMHSWMGWTYEASTVVQNYIFGYAVNQKGFSLHGLTVPPGTQVAVYWKMYTSHRGSHVFVSPPYVIGTWQTHDTHLRPKMDRRNYRERFQFLDALKLFFFGRLQSYLVSFSKVDYDSSSKTFVVTGIDQDGHDAQATITQDGTITIAEVAPPPSTTYQRLIIETFDPSGNGFAPNFDILELYSQSGASSAGAPYTYPDSNALASGENNNPNSNQTGYAYIDYQLQPSNALPSGTVLYVRVTGTSASATGPYALRVLTSPSSSYPTPGVAATSAYEPDETPTDSGVATVEPGQTISSYLTAGDVDWIKILLP